MRNGASETNDPTNLPQPRQPPLTPQQVDLTITLPERKHSGFTGGVGFSGQTYAEGYRPGPIGSFSFSHRNLQGKNQQVALSAELGQKDRLFRIHASDPWVLGDPACTSRNVSL